MNQAPLILIGAGGHCRAVIDVALSAGRRIAAIVGQPQELGKELVPGLTVSHTDQQLPLLAQTGGEFLVTVGAISDPSLRVKLWHKALEAGLRPAILIAHDAYVSPLATGLLGGVVMHSAVIGPMAKIGVNCIINTLADVEHDAVIGNHCHVSTGARVNGGCQVGDHTFIGSGAVMVQATTVASDCVIGAGAIVQKSIKEACIYAPRVNHLKVKK